ncbi:MAG: hypothetical protein J3Q66DRAFT_392095 [Benniella sp.]|nr:MAG: hypothetical protein J3Q66DRAFT_392095 [Benniella sp.]
MLVRHRRSVATLLLALSLFASLFYMKVWSSIDGFLGGTGHSSSAHQLQEQYDLSTDSLSPSPPQPQPKPLSLKAQQQLEKLRLKGLKELQRLERLERQRQKEEWRQQKAERLQRLQQQDKEPFPALISTNNARVNRLNQRAFNKFCQPTKPIDLPNEDTKLEHQQQQRQEEKISNNHQGPKAVFEGSESEQRRLLTEVIDFETYDEWMKYTLDRYSGYAYDADDEGDKGALNPSLEPRRPMFLERPLRGWIINHTATLEPCDRTKHTAAYCLAYLAQEHLHLVPSREARDYPNRIHTIPPKDTSIQDMELGISNGQDPESAPPPSSFLRTAPSSTNSAMMHFHIFWRGAITDKLSLAAHAFLFSQPLDRARLHLWIDSTDLPEGQPEDYSQNPFARDLTTAPINQFIKLHAWDQEAQETYAYPPLQQGSVDEESSGITGSLPQQKARIPPVALSDEARFLILYRYGGMYLDADVLLLRDMSPLYDAGMEFAYEWSNTGMYNTAVLRLNRGSSVARRILDGAKAREQEIMATKQAHQKGKGVALDRLSSRRKKPKHSQGSGRPQSVSSSMKDESERNSKHADDDSLFTLETPSSSPASIAPRRLVKRREMRPNEIYHPARLRGYLDPVGGSLRNNGLIMLPTAMFDPLWLRVDGVESASGLLNDKEMMMEGVKTFPEVLTNPDIVCPGQQHPQGQEQGHDFSSGPEVFFTGAYAYHWHNSWLTRIEPKSWMGLMRKAFDEYLTGERPNLYGEYFQDNEDDIGRR